MPTVPLVGAPDGEGVSRSASPALCVDTSTRKETLASEFGWRFCTDLGGNDSRELAQPPRRNCSSDKSGE